MTAIDTWIEAANATLTMETDAADVRARKLTGTIPGTTSSAALDSPCTTAQNS
jgi:hypothetical protein